MSMETEVPRTLHGLGQVFAFADRFSRENKLPPSSHRRLDLVLEELFTNLVRHNQGGRDTIHVELSKDGGRVRLKLVDRDVPAIPPLAPRASDPDATLQSRSLGGWGLHLIEHFVERVTHAYSGGDHHVEAIIDLEDVVFEIKQDDRGTIVLSGRFDARQVDAVREVLASVQETCKVDFMDLDYISSAGLGVMLSCQKRLADRGQELLLANLNPHIREIFEIALPGVFTIQ